MAIGGSTGRWFAEIHWGLGVLPLRLARSVCRTRATSHFQAAEPTRPSAKLSPSLTGNRLTSATQELGNLERG